MTRKGEKTFGDLILLEHKLWDRKDYNEEDLPLFSIALDFIESHYREFEKFCESLSEDGNA